MNERKNDLNGNKDEGLLYFLFFPITAFLGLVVAGLVIWLSGQPLIRQFLNNPFVRLFF